MQIAVALGALAVELACARLALAEDLPSLQPGLWSFSSTVIMKGSSKPQTRSLRKCTDASDDIRKKWAMLAQQSCKFTPVARTGNRYSYSSTCQRNGMALEMKSTLTVDSRTAYRVETESRTNSQVQKEVVVAQRVGACTK